MQFLLQAAMNQRFFNQAVQNQELQPGPVTLPTCEQQLATSNGIIAGFFRTLPEAVDILSVSVSFVSAREDEPGASDVLPILERTLFTAVTVLPAGEAAQAIGPLVPCEESLRTAQSIVGGLVNLFDRLIIPALSLMTYFLVPRTDQLGAQALLDRIRAYIARVNATILPAARAVLPLSL